MSQGTRILWNMHKQPTPPGKPLFFWRRTVATPAVLEAFDRAQIIEWLDAHQSGDWGCVDEHDAEVNNAAMTSGARLLSAHEAPGDDRRVWIITEAVDGTGTRSASTVLFPQEY